MTKWKCVDLESGRDTQIVSSESERDRFMQHCNRQRIRCGLVRVSTTGIVVEHQVPEVD